MSGEKDEAISKPAFDAGAASVLGRELRTAFCSGKTRSYLWRESQLKALLKLTEEHEHDIAEALHADIAKPQLESRVY